MMINLNNYEEYFLLYIDNELSTEQRNAVEAFVAQHPHLATEFEMLQGAKLPMDETVLFGSKSSLYKTADDSININNYETYFLLHTDKELSALQEEEVEHFVLQHPQLQEDFLLLQRTRLIPENIGYPGKSRLYKQSSKRIIPLYVMRMAVAAAITGVVLLVANSLIDNGNHPQVAVNAPQNAAVKENGLPPKKDSVIIPDEKNRAVAVTKKETKLAVSKPGQSIKISAKKAVSIDNEKSGQEPVLAQIDPPLAPQQQASPAPEEVIASNNAVPKQEHATALKLLDEVDEKEAESTVMYVSNDNAAAKPVIYKELNTEDDNQTLYVGSLQLNKAKVNGLLKKATHLLGGKPKESNL